MARTAGAGETVLVLGATGAAGKMTIKATRMLGAGRVIAAGRRQDVLAKLAADATIDLTLSDDALTDAFAAKAKHGIGIVVDYLRGRPVAATASSQNVRLVSIGDMAGESIMRPLVALRGSRLKIVGRGTADFPPTPAMEQIVAGILARAHIHELTIPGDPAPLAAVSRAWAGAADARPVLLIG